MTRVIVLDPREETAPVATALAPRLTMEPVLTGRVLAHVDQRRPDLRRPFPERFAERLTGRRVAGLGRRSKYLLIGLDGGETWIIHLGMSGRILVDTHGPPPYPSPTRGEGSAKHEGSLLSFLWCWIDEACEDMP